MKTSISALAVAALMGSGVALAQNSDTGGSEGLVVVDVTAQEVANDIARDLDVTAQDVIDVGSVQVPVGIAANVCDVDANVLAQQTTDEGGATCEAQNTSTAFTKAVQDGMNQSDSGSDTASGEEGGDQNSDAGGSSGLVVVDVTAQNVANNIAEDLDVTAQDVIDVGSVQVPVGIAANVCDVDANVLAQQKNGDGGAACDATNSSEALTEAVQDSMNKSKS